jgi:cytochrome c553
MRYLPLLLLASALPLDAAVTADSASTPLTTAQTEFFEKRIRPVLVEKCYGCHSADAERVKGGLLLDTREGIRHGGESGHAVVPGDTNQSLLLTAMKWEDKDMRMPPEKEGGKLSDEVIADFEKWIQMGAPDPREGSGVKPVAKEWDIAKGREFWAFQPPKSAPAPTVKDAAWPRSDVDRYLRAAQEAKGLKPVADADPRTLVRRIYFDLIGLPPTPLEVEAFVAESVRNPQSAIESLVDRLLASPQFGERWGRHWLDVARYAESTGRERNFTFPEAYRYRDYVIAALNADKPYDEFLREQIAGDLLPHRSDDERNEHLIATGFLALGPKGLNEKNREQFRMDLIDEQIDTTTRAVLGVTVACARCHDHKFDPIPQKDYYAVAGIFRSTDTHFGTGSATYNKAGQKNKNGTALLPLVSKEQPEPMPASAPAEQTAPAARPDIDEMLKRMAARDPKIAARLQNLSPEQKRAFAERFAGKNGSAPAPAAPTSAAKPNYDELLKRLAQRDPKKAARLKNLPEKQRADILRKYAEKAGLVAGAGMKARKSGKGDDAATASPSGPVAMGVKEGSPTDARLLVRGEIEQPGESVPRGFVQVMINGPAPAIPADASGRLEFAEWLTSPTNPLTARVAVNRIWMHLFGDGLVRTPDNFGATGEKPSHPELLDALALQFIRDGWSVKKFVRSLVLSRTYQLSSAVDRTAIAADPDNRLLWRAAPRRLDAEALRDAMLAVSGQIDLVPAKGSAVSAIGDGYIGRGIRPESFTGYETTRRSVYLPVVRDFVPEVLEIFDFAEPSLVVAERDVTNVPSQALYLMNNSFVRTQAAAMAKRVLAAPAVDRIALAYQLALSRPPTDAERLRADRYLRGDADGLQRVNYASDASVQDWATFCQALFACAEFRFVR